MKYLALLLLALTTPALSANYRLVDLEKLEFNYAQLTPNTRDPYLPEDTGKWKERTSLKFRMGLLNQKLYWDNNVHGETVNTGIFRSVGWQWELGLRITDKLVLYRDHHSRHVMEKIPPKRFNAGSQFPVEDSYGIKLILIKETTGKGIW